MANLLENMLKPVNVPAGGGGGRVAKIRPAALSVSAGKLEVIVIDPSEPEVVASKAGDLIGLVGDLIDLGKKIFGGGGGGGGGGQKCTSKISQTTKPDGTITTTIETTCQPA